MVDMTPAPPTTYEKGKLYQIPIADFKLDPDQPRKVIDPDALAELAASIEKFGILQPILFRVAEQGGIYIVAGERRYAAAQKAGLIVLPAICVTGNYAEIALIENLQRQDLTAVEEAEALLRLKDEQKYTDEQLAVVIGKARTTLTEILSLNRLPPAIRNDCRGDRKIATRADDRIAEYGQGPLRTCKYPAEDERCLRDCRQCMMDAGRHDIRKGVTRFYRGSRHTFEPTQYYKSAEYHNVPVRKNVPCDWPYAARRYNGSGINSYHYQTIVLKNLLAV